MINETQKPASLTLENVSWGNGIIDTVSFHLEPGKTLVIVGPNGSGKSSLLRLIYGFKTPQAGQIFINNCSINNIAPSQLAKTIAVVLQDQPSDFSLNVQDIISLGRAPHLARFGRLEKRDHHIIESALTLFKLEHLANRSYSSLSGGEKQRTMFARAFCQEPSIIVLDEPTNHLDIGYQLELINLVQQMGITVISSLHDLNLVPGFADEILILNKGKMIAYGPIENNLTPDLIKQSFNVIATPRGIARFDFSLCHQ